MNGWVRHDYVSRLCRSIVGICGADQVQEVRYLCLFFRSFVDCKWTVPITSAAVWVVCY